jgi:hypothetical protein
VDGVLSPDEEAAARRRPEVVARAARLEAGRTALRAVPGPDPVARERALTAALAAFDAEAPASVPSDRPPPPVRAVPVAGPGAIDLAAHRQSRSGGAQGDAARRGLPRWFGAAAAAVALLAGLVGLAALSSDGDGDNDTAMDVGSSQEQSDDGAASAGDSAEAPTAAPESGGSEARQARPLEVGDLGTFPSGDALVDHVQGITPDSGTAEVQPESSAPLDADEEALGTFSSCEGAPPPPLDDPGAVLELHGRAVIGTQAVEVWIVDAAAGRRVVAVDAACAVTVDRPLG